ncbi:hypothetical protein [Jeotgalibacillus marinus]|uniref:Uncharacterized protein n=1 Tax=Jeotgalibacillus marinus TaxID=86667 RepID=A0ABV3Q7L4_9BACL
MVVLLAACNDTSIFKDISTSNDILKSNDILASSEYKTDMKQVRKTVRAAYEDDMRELTDEENNLLKYLTSGKYEGEFTGGTDELAAYLSHILLVTKYSGFVGGHDNAGGHEDEFLRLLVALEEDEIWYLAE